MRYPALWLTYLSDPASITMEGILIFKEHLLFLLIVIVVLIGWLILLSEKNQPKSDTANGKKRKRKEEEVTVPEKPNIRPIKLKEITIVPKNSKTKK